MYIEFSLPNGSAGQAAAHSLMIIRKGLVEWGLKYDIPYSEKTIKYTHRLCFDDPEHYSFFAMTWNPEKRYHALGRWRIVSDLNNKSSFDSVL
jgi:hypothetical protein